MNFCAPNANMPPTSMGGGGGNGGAGNNHMNNNSNNKEPNLMPVPSPQQIQYLNQFEGQELTIQKQPNSAPPGAPGGNPQHQMGGGGPGGMMHLMDSPHPDVSMGNPMG